MELIKVIPRGYCKGVTRAITIAKQTALAHPHEPIYILGMLVHNNYVIEALRSYNIVTLDSRTKTREELLDEITSGIVIFTAHGIHPHVKKKAKEKGLTCIDASCLDVLRTQDIVMDELDKNKTVLYIGKANHPEAAAVCDHNPRVHLIECEDDIHALSISGPIFVTNQTTMSYQDVAHLFECIDNTFEDVSFSDEICSATRTRQEAVAALEAIDALIVVGDKASNNATRLAQIAREKGILNVYLINDVNELNVKHICTYNRVAITAGASTPTYLINQVIHCLEHNIYEPLLVEHSKII